MLYISSIWQDETQPCFYFCCCQWNIQKHGLRLILHFKSDNCSTQYKCKWVFRFWSNLVKKLNTKIIIYYGVSGHVKGLVDAMGVFGVKSPLTRAVITQNLEYSCAKDIYEYLKNHFRDFESKLYSILSHEEISKFVINDSPLSITNFMKLNMLFSQWIYSVKS